MRKSKRGTALRQYQKDAEDFSLVDAPQYRAEGADSIVELTTGATIRFPIPIHRDNFLRRIREKQRRQI